MNFYGIRKTNSPGKMVLKHWDPRNHFIQGSIHFGFILLCVFLKMAHAIRNAHLQSPLLIIKMGLWWSAISLYKRAWDGLVLFFYLWQTRLIAYTSTWPCAQLKNISQPPLHIWVVMWLNSDQYDVCTSSWVDFYERYFKRGPIQLTGSLLFLTLPTTWM